MGKRQTDLSKGQSERDREKATHKDIIKLTQRLERLLAGTRRPLLYNLSASHDGGPLCESSVFVK